MSVQHFITIYVFFWRNYLNNPALSGWLVFRTPHTANIISQPSRMIRDSDTFNAFTRNTSSLLAYIEFCPQIL